MKADGTLLADFPTFNLLMTSMISFSSGGPELISSVVILCCSRNTGASSSSTGLLSVASAVKCFLKYSRSLIGSHFWLDLCSLKEEWSDLKELYSSSTCRRFE